MESLKNRYKKHLIVFLIVNIAVYMAVSIGGNLADVTSTVDILMSEKGVFILLAPIIILILNGIVSAEWKARLVFLKYSNPLPGSEAFSKHMNDDPRINIDNIKNCWGTLPVEPADQNRLWYKMYRSVDTDVRVHEAHYDWLFTRDLTSLAIIFLTVLSIIGLFVISSLKIYGIYLLALLVQYFLIANAAKTYGKRFVSNVLVCVSQGTESN